MNPYTIYTLYYGTREATTADYFLDDTSNIPIGMGYYLWVATNSEYTVVVDLGYHGHDPEAMRRLPIYADGIALLA